MGWWQQTAWVLVTVVVAVCVIHVGLADHATSRRELNAETRSRTVELKDTRLIDNRVNDRRRVTDSTRRETVREDRREVAVRRDNRETRRDARQDSVKFDVLLLVLKIDEIKDEKISGGKAMM